MKRAATYLRVSTKKQADKELPIDGQRAACAKLILTEGWHAVAEYVDAGRSGDLRANKRPGLRALIDDAKAGRFQAVVAWAGDRTTRDVDLAGWVRVELGDVELVTVTHRHASKIERRQLDMNAEMLLDGIRESTKRGVRQNVENGGRHGADTFGYVWVNGINAPHPRRTICEDEARIVRHFFARIAAGDSLHSIARSIGWRPDRLRYALRNPVYVGAAVIGKQVRENGRRRLTKRTEWEVHWGKHEPIVERVVWDQVQSILDRDSGNLTREGKIALSGLLVCACQTRLSLNGLRDVAAGRKFAYRCRRCGERHVLAVGDTARLVRSVCDHYAQPELAAVVLAHLKAAYRSGEQAGNAKAEIKRLERARETLLDLCASGDVTDTRALAKRLEGIQSELASAEARLGAASVPSALPTLAEIRGEFARVARMARSIAASPEVDYAARPFLHATLDGIGVDGESFELRPSEIIPGQGPLHVLGFAWRLPRQAA